MLPSKYSFAEIANDFLYLRCKVHHASEDTTDLYRQRLQRFIDWCETRSITPTSLTAKNVEDYLYPLTRLRDGKPLKPNTLRVHSQILKTYLLYAERHKMIPASIDFEMPPMPKAKIEYLSEQQQQELLNHPELSIRDKALCAFIMDAGARMVEWRALRWSDISFDPAVGMGTAWLHKVKRPGDPRETYLFQATWDYLQAYREEYELNDDDPVFVGAYGSYEVSPTSPDEVVPIFKPITSIGGGAIFRRITEKVGFPVRAHLLRHTAGRNMALAGVSPPAIQRVMGHANLKTTERYTALNEEDTRTLFLKVAKKNGRSDESRTQET